MTDIISCWTGTIQGFSFSGVHKDCVQLCAIIVSHDEEQIKMYNFSNTRNKKVGLNFFFINRMTHNGTVWCEKNQREIKPSSAVCSSHGSSLASEHHHSFVLKLCFIFPLFWCSCQWILKRGSQQSQLPCQTLPKAQCQNTHSRVLHNRLKGD